MAKQKQSKQNRQGRKKKFQNESGQALKSLLSDQVESSLKREIGISHGTIVSVSKEEMESKQSSQNQEKDSRDEALAEGQDYRKMPGSRETKAQILERMQKLVEEMDRLERDYHYMRTQLDQAVQDKKEKDLELKQLQTDKERLEEEAASKAMLVSQHQSREKELKAELDKNIQTREQLEERLKAADDNWKQQIREKDQQIMELESEADRNAQAREELEGKLRQRDQKLEQEALEKSSLASEVQSLRTNAAELQEKISRLEQQNKGLEREKRELLGKVENMKKKNEDKNIQVETGGEMSSTDWRKKADNLWNGVSYAAPQQAIEYLTAAIEKDPQRAELHNDRGLANMDEYRMQESLNDFSTAVNLKPDFGEAYHNRGVVLLKQGKEFAARKDFQMAASHGVWMGLNYLQQPKHTPSLWGKILASLGLKRGEQK